MYENESEYGNYDDTSPYTIALIHKILTCFIKFIIKIQIDNTIIQNQIEDVNFFRHFYLVILIFDWRQYYWNLIE